MDLNQKYILDEHGEPRPEPDLFKWAEWFEHFGNRIVKQDQIGDVRISTVFLGLDHRFSSGGPPILWETMIFGGQFDHGQWWYCSLAEARAGHAKRVLNGQVRPLVAQARTRRFCAMTGHSTRCTTTIDLPKTGRFQCAANRGHQHAHVQMDEASGGLIFWESEWHWWYSANITEQELKEMLRISAGHDVPVPSGISWELFRRARGLH